jgi:hypothetical protein
LFENTSYISGLQCDMNFQVPSIQVEESEHSHENDYDKNHDSYASRQSEYEDSRGECSQHHDGSYYSQNENVVPIQ